MPNIPLQAYLFFPLSFFLLQHVDEWLKFDSCMWQKIEEEA